MVSLPDGEASGRNSLGGSGSGQSGLVLPVQRIKMIMKSCPDVDSVPQESLHTVTKATELFIAFLAMESYKKGDVSKTLQYDSLSDVVKSDSKLEFLMETVPNKITWSQCQKLMAEKQEKIDNFI